MIDAHTEAVLRDALRRESLSMLRYVGAAFPWTAGGGAALRRLAEIEAEDREATAALGKFLVRRRVPPPAVGSFPMGFTTINFLSLEYLLPKLVESQRRALADLERDAAAVADADAKAELEQLLAVKRFHLSELEGLKVPRGEATKV